MITFIFCFVALVLYFVIAAKIKQYVISISKMKNLLEPGYAKVIVAISLTWPISIPILLFIGSLQILFGKK